MKQQISYGLIVSVLVVPMACASTSRTIIEVPVVSVDPLIRTSSLKIPHKSCRDEQIKVVQAGPSYSATPGIVGALIGGTVAAVLGHNSHYQPVIAGAGAVLGASIGHDVGHRRNTRSYYVTEQRCTVDVELREQETVYGYRVGYRYGDSIYYTETQTDPGETIRLRVDLQPMD